MTHYRPLPHVLLLLGLAAGLTMAEEPVTTVRSVSNGVSNQPALANVAQGAMLTIVGESLASASISATNSAEPPLSLDDPAVQVTVNGVPAPLFLVSPQQINAQVPSGVEAGLAQVIVQRGGVSSIAMPVIVTPTSPNLFQMDGTTAVVAETAGSSTVADPSSPPAQAPTALAVETGATLTVYGVGLGPMATAEGSEVLTPEIAQRAYIGGLPSEILAIRSSTNHAGVYEMDLQVPQHAQSGEILSWVAGNNRGAGILGSRGTATPRYLSAGPSENGYRRIDLSDLNPYFVALSGAIDDDTFCYQDVLLLDYRRDTVTPVTDCLFPSNPNSDVASAYRPFELSLNTQILGALAEPAGDTAGAVTNRMMLVDTATGAVSHTTIQAGADRLRSSAGGGANFRVDQAPTAKTLTFVEPGGDVGDSGPLVADLPSPLSVDGLETIVGQGVGFGNGVRLRFLGSSADAEGTPTFKAVLFNREATVAAKADFPAGWRPLSPPRRVNAQGFALGQSLAAATSGFGGDDRAHVLVRMLDGSQDGVISFHAGIPAEEEGVATSMTLVASAVTPFPAGTYAATCHPQVRWQRIALRQRLAVIASGERMTEFRAPAQGQICAGDRLLVYDPSTSEFEQFIAPGPLDVAAKGVVRGYLYFGDGARQEAIRPPGKVHVFDGVASEFSTIDVPNEAGVVLNGVTQRLQGRAQLVALASGGPLRTNPRTGAQLPPFPGNRGLVILDLDDLAAFHLPLPDGYQRLVPGPNTWVQEGRRGFGVMPLLNRAFARAAQPRGGPGMPGQTRMLTWDVETAVPVPTVLPVPEGGYAVVQRVGGGGGGGAARPMLWDFQQKSGTIAYGVYDRPGMLIAVGVLAP